jgi:hypothetical protein
MPSFTTIVYVTVAIIVVVFQKGGRSNIPHSPNHACAASASRKRELAPDLQCVVAATYILRVAATIECA